MQKEEIRNQSAKGGDQEVTVLGDTGRSKAGKGRKTISGGKDFIKIKVSGFKL